MKQIGMFNDGADLPLFSRVAQRAPTQQMNQAPVGCQTSFARCGTCLDTGIIDNQFCWCSAGQQARNNKE